MTALLLALHREIFADEGLEGIERYPAYLSIEVPNHVTFELQQIAEQLGRPYDAPTFLVIMSSFNGRISVEDDRITISSEII